MTVKERCDLLNAVAAGIEKRFDDVLAAETPIPESRTRLSVATIYREGQPISAFLQTWRDDGIVSIRKINAPANTTP